METDYSVKLLCIGNNDILSESLAALVCPDDAVPFLPLESIESYGFPLISSNHPFASISSINRRIDKYNVTSVIWDISNPGDDKNESSTEANVEISRKVTDPQVESTTSSVDDVVTDLQSNKTFGSDRDKDPVLSSYYQDLDGIIITLKNLSNASIEPYIQQIKQYTEGSVYIVILNILDSTVLDSTISSDTLAEKQDDIILDYELLQSLAANNIYYYQFPSSELNDIGTQLDRIIRGVLSYYDIPIEETIYSKHYQSPQDLVIQAASRRKAMEVYSSPVTKSSTDPSVIHNTLPMDSVLVIATQVNESDNQLVVPKRRRSSFDRILSLVSTLPYSKTLSTPTKDMIEVSLLNQTKSHSSNHDEVRKRGLSFTDSVRDILYTKSSSDQVNNESVPCDSLIRASSLNSLIEGIPQEQWTSDIDSNHCEYCQVEFSILTRRHHCRRCGKLLCYKCCPSHIRGNVIGYEGQVRICKECWIRVESSLSDQKDININRQTSDQSDASNVSSETEAKIDPSIE